VKCEEKAGGGKGGTREGGCQVLNRHRGDQQTAWEDSTSGARRKDEDRRERKITHECPKPPGGGTRVGKPRPNSAGKKRPRRQEGEQRGGDTAIYKKVFWGRVGEDYVSNLLQEAGLQEGGHEENLRDEERSPLERGERGNRLGV